MTPLWFRLRAEARRHWRAWLVLAVLAGAVGATTIAAAAGARRTAGAYDRFLEEQRAEVAALPGVVDSAQASYEFSALPDSTAYVSSADDRLGTEINRLRIVEGRAYDPDAVDEAVIGFDLAENADLDVGDRIPLVDERYLPPEGLGPRAQREFQEFLDALPGGTARVVGIEASPGEFPPQFGDIDPLIHLTPAFARQFGGGSGQLLALRLAGGAAAVPDFLRRLEPLSGGQPFFPIVQAEQAHSVQRSIRLQVVALWVFAALAAVTGVLVLVQVFSRTAVVESEDDEALRALGLVRRQVVTLSLLRGAVIGGVAVVVAVAAAVLTSPVAPIGLARLAEPDPGVRADGPALFVGGLVVVALAVVLSAVPVWWSTRRGVQVTGPARPTLGARVAAATGLGPVPGTGARIALEPGRGPTAVPVRSTVVVLALGLATLSGVLVFGASLRHLLTTPRLYGQAWDLAASDFAHHWTADDIPDDPRILGAAIGDTGLPIELDGEPSGALLLRRVRGEVGPPVIEGRLPRAGEEVALGRRTARALGVGVGDTVEARVPPAEPVSLRVVGEVVLPQLNDRAGLGQGALLDPSAGRRLVGPSGPGPGGTVYLDLAPGASEQGVLETLGGALDTVLVPLPQAQPDDIVNFGRVDALPWVLAGLIGAFTLATLGGTLLAGSRRRARDLAVLGALGMRRRQRRAVLSCEGAVLTALAVVFGVPMGVAVGRWAWIVLADRTGVVAEPTVPSLLVLVALPLAALAAAGVLGALAARTRRRGVDLLSLRTE